MRGIRTSRTFDDQLVDLLAFGEQAFGRRVADEKRLRVYRTIRQFLAVHPATKQPDPVHGLCVYPIARTPFVVLYDFDDNEIRLHFVFHRSADLSGLEPNSAVF